MRLSHRTRLRLVFAWVAIWVYFRIAQRFVRRVVLAARFYFRLNYSWRLAWIKADRGQA